MDTKQIQTSLFTDGLNTDLHPLTATNSMLTDCINGTIITYNGNEYILQNDMGNYQLKKAQLSADYIPVGIKEYGNIIYIVSYNPLDKKCQIGSYPSPQIMFDNRPKTGEDENYKGIQINEFNDSWRWSDDDLSAIYYTNSDNSQITIKKKSSNTVFFTDYSSDQNLKVLFPGEGDINDTFLNPGDKYHLCLIDPGFSDENNDDYKLTYAFQKIDFYTLTESKEVYKIDKEIEVERIAKDVPLDDIKFKNVNWETPGWIGYKPSILNLDSFNIYITDLDIPIFKDEESSVEEGQIKLTNVPDTPPEGGTEANYVTFNLQGQITITPDFSWSKNYKNIRILLEYKMSNSETSEESDWNFLETLSLEEDSETDYGNKIKVLTYNSNSAKINSKNNDGIIIRATPYILESQIIDYDLSKGIIYDNFVVYQQINLKGIGNITDVECFDTYKYLVSNDGVTINFSISFLSKSSKNKVVCKYQIQEIGDGFSGTFPITATSSSTEITIEDCNLLGQNILYIPFRGQGNSIPFIEKEEIYVFSLKFYGIDEKTSKEVEIYAADQLLITSEIMNDFYDSKDRFQEIYLNEWLPKASEYQVTYPREYENANFYTLKISSKFESNYFVIDNIQQLYEPNTDKLIGNSDDIETAVKNCKVKYDSPINAYVGGINRIIDTQQYELTTPYIMLGKHYWQDGQEHNHLWSDCSYKIFVSAKSSISGTNTTGQRVLRDLKLDLVDEKNPDKNDPTKPTISENKVVLVDKNSKFKYQYDLIWANWLCYPFVSSELLTEYTGDRIYLSRNMPFIYGRQNGWGYEPRYLDKKISPLGMWIFQDRYNYQQWKEPYEQLKEKGIVLGKKGDKKSARMSIGESNHYVKTATFHTPDEDGVIINTDARDEWNSDTADAAINIRVNKSSLFIPVLFNVYGSGRYAGWSFPDKGFRERHQGAGEGLALLCKNNDKYTIAIVKFTEDKNLKGKFTYSNESYNTFYLTNNNFNGNKSPWSYNDIFTKYILGLGLHLYYYTNIYSSRCYSIINANQLPSSNAINDIWVKYTREDTLAIVKYKNIELQKGYNINNLKLKKCTDTDNFNLKLQNNRNITFNTVSNEFSTLKHNFYVEDYLGEGYNFLDDSKINQYVSKVSEKADNVILDIKATGRLNTRTMYNDYTMDSILSPKLDEIAKLFEVSNTGNGYKIIYLKNLPEANIRGRYETSKYTKYCFRSIDLSSYFNINKQNYMTILNQLSEVTPEWYEFYRTKVQNSKLGEEGIDYSLDEEEVNNKDN